MKSGILSHLAVFGASTAPLLLPSTPRCLSPAAGSFQESSHIRFSPTVSSSSVLGPCAWQLSSVHSTELELRSLLNDQNRRIGGGKHGAKEKGRWGQRVCAQLAESNQVLEDATQRNASKCVLVVGATGGVGQLIVASLLERGLPVRAVLRNPEKGHSLFGDQDPDKLQVHVGDTRRQEMLDSSLFEGVTHVICCTGTTAFPSKRWDGDNGPEQTDWQGVRNLVEALPLTIQRCVLVSSVGVTKGNQLPWSIMNLFGVLKYKKLGEDFLRNSGVPFTIIRPGRLTDGPYTSYDLNTLLKATAGTRRNVIVGQGDTLVGEASRVIVAEACIQTLDLPCTVNQTYEINSVEGDGPGKDHSRWEVLFKAAEESSASN